MSVFDLSAPADPRFLSNIPVESGEESFTVIPLGDYVCLGAGGLHYALPHCSVSSAIEGDSHSPLPLPQATRLLGARPNPFHLGTSIDFTLSGPQHVRIAIYDLAGRLVRVLADRRFVTGEHSLDWNGIGPAGRKVAPAVYLIRLEGESATDESKAVFLK